MHAHLESRYLLPQSIAFIERLLITRPVLGSLLLLAIFGAVLGVLRRIFGRIAADMVLFALIIWAILILVGSSFYTLLHVKGFHFGG